MKLEVLAHSRRKCSQVEILFAKPKFFIVYIIKHLFFNSTRKSLEYGDGTQRVKKDVGATSKIASK